MGYTGGLSGATQVSHDANAGISVDVLWLQGYDNSTYRRKK